jgi:ribosome-associated protein
MDVKPEDIRERIPESELKYFTSRSSGPGGQNINKVNTKVGLRFDIKNSHFFSEQEKERLCEKLKNRINNLGELILTSQDERTQAGNRNNVTEKFYKLIAAALTRKPVRRATRPSRSSQTERLQNKKNRGDIKKLRRSQGNNNDENN